MKFKNKNKFLNQVNVDLDGYLHPYNRPSLDYIRAWNSKIKRRDRWRCKICKKSKNLIVHHIIHKYHYPELRFVKNNGITLCVDCEGQCHENNLNVFMPARIKVPSLKQIIERRPKRLSIWSRMVSYFKKWRKMLN